MNQSVAIMMGITLMISAISGIYWVLEENPDTQVQAIDPPQVVQSVNLNNSHQYWNVNPMGMGNITEIALNGSGDLHFNLVLTGYFHEPLLWDQGYVNYTISQENETLFSVQVNHTLEETHNFTWLNMSGNITIEIQSTGSDNPTDDKPGDYYITRAEFELTRV